MTLPIQEFRLRNSQLSQRLENSWALPIEEVQACQSVPDQIQNIRPAEDIFEIHSYCSQQKSENVEVDVVSLNTPEGNNPEPVAATPKVYKSKGKVGPPTVQNENTEVLKKVQNGNHLLFTL